MTVTTGHCLLHCPHPRCRSRWGGVTEAHSGDEGNEIPARGRTAIKYIPARFVGHTLHPSVPFILCLFICTLRVWCVGSGFPSFLLFLYDYLSYVVCYTHVFSCICMQNIHVHVHVFRWVKILLVLRMWAWHFQSHASYCGSIQDEWSPGPCV